MSMTIEARELKLAHKAAELDELEKELKRREKAIKQKEKEKKQVLLRLAPSLWNEIAKWAEDDFRSINGQIEYLLSEAVNRRR